MKKITFSVIVAYAALLLSTACKKNLDESASLKKEEIPQEVLSQIKNLGFGTSSVQKVGEDYLIEGDILLTKDHLNGTHNKEILRVSEEQYRTFNGVTRLPRTITVRVSSTLPNNSAYVTATDAAIARYNALQMDLKFRRVSSGGEIVLSNAPSGVTYLASAGFPYSSGDPYPSIVINNNLMGSYPHLTKTTIIAHEIGHSIGFRHTDYMNRLFSGCQGPVVNEGAGTMGAIQIPGTPSGPDPNSWMLACISSGVNRPFNANDQIALRNRYMINHPNCVLGCP